MRFDITVHINQYSPHVLLCHVSVGEEVETASQLVLHSPAWSLLTVHLWIP